MFHRQNIITDKKDCTRNNIGTLYKRAIANLNSEIACLTEQLVTKSNYFQEKILFLQKRLNNDFQKLAHNEYLCKQNKTNLPSHITK